MTKNARIYNGEKITSSINDFGKTGHFYSNNRQGKQDINIGDYIKPKSFCTAKETLNKTK